MDSIFVQLALVLTLSSIIGFIVRKLNLPLLIAYLSVGVLLSSLLAFKFTSSPVAILPDIGAALVLFLIGMELDFREIGSVGKAIVISSITQIFLSALAGHTLATFFGFSSLEALYLG